LVAVLMLLAGLEAPATRPAYCPGAASGTCMHLCDGVHFDRHGRRATGTQLRCDTTREERKQGRRWWPGLASSMILFDESRRRSVLQPLHSRSRAAHETRHGACGGGRVALQCAGGDATAARKTGQTAGTDAGAGDERVQEEALEGAAREIAAARAWLGSQDAANFSKVVQIQ
jgi:hypothetical protein